MEPLLLFLLYGFSIKFSKNTIPRIIIDIDKDKVQHRDILIFIKIAWLFEYSYPRKNFITLEFGVIIIREDALDGVQCACMHKVHIGKVQAAYSRRSRPSRLVVPQTLMTSLSLIRILRVTASAASYSTFCLTYGRTIPIILKNSFSYSSWFRWLYKKRMTVRNSC